MHLVEAMLQGTPARVKQRLAEAGADIAIIGRRQVCGQAYAHTRRRTCMHGLAARAGLTQSATRRDAYLHHLRNLEHIIWLGLVIKGRVAFSRG